MKIYIKNSISNSDIKSIKNNLFLYYGNLKDESDKFFDDLDEVIYQEELDGEEHPKARLDFYNKYLPLANKCFEIFKSICTDRGGHTIDLTIRYEMYQMAKEILLNFPDTWGEKSAQMEAAI